MPEDICLNVKREKRKFLLRFKSDFSMSLSKISDLSYIFICLAMIELGLGKFNLSFMSFSLID